jgi:hypothetical protein
VLGGAESKDPGDACLTHAVRSFSTTEGWRRAKKLSLIRTINPEFIDLAQTWGWKMITQH